ncbi:MAG: glycosyltransferase family 4 protein [Acidobacteriota bacterium]
MALNACTIVSKNYICFARVLCDSFLEHHPEGRFFVLLVDRNDGSIDPGSERFTLLEAEDLADQVPNLRGFLFKYTLLECNTAIKPFLLEHLIDAHDLENLIYFDPDIQILGSLDELAGHVAESSVVLTPHLTHPIDDDASPGEQAILQSGSYNLGFVAFRVDDVSRRVIRWWQERLYDRCVVRIDQGLFVDQKWMDLVPGLFENVRVLRHPGYNVAYWNLHGRSVETLADGRATSNGQPLVFFHFSGIEPERLDGVSKHQDRFTLADIGGAADLYRDYSARVLKAGWRECRSWPYAFARFSNGVPIQDAARALYLQLGEEEQRAWPDPFESEAPNSFFSWLNAPSERLGSRHVSRFLAHLHWTRPELRSAFPDPAGRDLAAFRAWLLDVGRHQLKIDPAYLAGLPPETVADLLTPGGLRRKVKNRLKRVYHSAAGKKAKATVKKMLGPERFRALKRQVRPAPAVPVAPALPSSIDIRRPGVNLIGYLDAETGMGEAARGLARALRHAGIPTSLHTLGLGVVARREEGAEFAGATSTFPHDINLFVVNADQVLPVQEHLGLEVYRGRYNIGLWLWELEEFPSSLAPAFGPLQEIWTPSTYCLEALSAVSPVPVRRMPLAVSLREERTSFSREHFGIPEDAFLALYLFNYLSYAERKNPYAAVQAFLKAFGDDPTKILLLKTSQKDFAPEDHRRLQELAGDAGNIRFIDDYLSRDEIDALIGLADVYLSLHRSEGFGLTVAEAMLHETPVIATPYSGVTDFFDLNGGWPVRYRVVTLEKDEGPYPAGSRWAEPDIEHAAALLRSVAEGGAEAHERVQKARRQAESRLGVDAVSRRLERQVLQLSRRFRSIPGQA